MSPRAACRLEQLGVGPVHDYAAGKVDWMAAGLLTVRRDTSERRAIDGVDRSPPTCPPGARVSELRDVAGRNGVLVVDAANVVLGRLALAQLHGAAGSACVEEVMDPAPSTIRAHVPLLPLLERMRSRGIAEIVVTTPEGVLLGVLRADGESPG